MFNRILQVTKHLNWSDTNVPEQVKALFLSFIVLCDEGRFTPVQPFILGNAPQLVSRGQSRNELRRLYFYCSKQRRAREFKIKIIKHIELLQENVL